MKIRMNSKKTMVGLAIGVGLIAGFGVMLSGPQTRAFDSGKTITVATAGFPVDESQENGGYVAAKVNSPRLMVIDEVQENGSGFTPNITANDDFYWPTSLEGNPKLGAAAGTVIDESQENGGYVTAQVTSPRLMVIDVDQENGGSFTPNITANDDFYWPTSLEGSLKLGGAPGTVIDESQENGGYVAAKVTSPWLMVIDESQENGVGR